MKENKICKKNSSGLQFSSVFRIWIRIGPNSIRSVDSYPDSESGSSTNPGGQKRPTQIEKKVHVLKCWMFSFEGWRLLLWLGCPFWIKCSIRIRIKWIRIRNTGSHHLIINGWTSSQPIPSCAAPCLGAGPVELAEQLSAEAAQDLAEAGAEGGKGGLAVPRLLLLPLPLPALLPKVLVVILRSVVVLSVQRVGNRYHYEVPAYRIADPDPYFFTSVLWIRDILVRIRTYVSCSFYVSGFHDANKI